MADEARAVRESGGEFRQGWPTLLGATGSVATGCSLFTITASFFLKPIAADFGWSRGDISLGITYAMLTNALLLPLVGWLTDRYGPGRVGTLGLTGFSLMCFVLAAMQPNLALYYPTLILTAACFSFCTVVVFAPLVAARFDRRRGMALGILMSGAAILMIPFAPVLSTVIAGFGWRAGYVLLGCMPLVIGLPCLLLATRQTPFVRPADRPKAAAEAGAGSAFRTLAFWKIALGSITGALAIGGFLHHLAPMFSDKGISTTEVAVLGTTFVVMSTVGRTVVGVLLDLLHPPMVALVVMVAAAGAAILMLFGEPSLIAGMIIVTLVGAAMGAEADFHAFFVARQFGVARFSGIFSVICMFVAASLGLGALLFGKIFDATGSYEIALYAATGLLVASGLLFGSISRKPVETVAADSGKLAEAAA